MVATPRFERQMDERLGRRYPTRRQALDVAGELEPYTGGVRLTARGDECTLTALGFDWSEACDLPYDHEGHALIDHMDFEVTPGEYRVAPFMGSMMFDKLTLVCEWLDGGFDTMDIYLLKPVGWLPDDDDDDDERMVDASYWAVWCADRVDAATA